MASSERQQRSHADYTVACICPMGIELAPVEAMLDEIHTSLPTSRDLNAYTLGELGGHNIVIAIMSKIGNNVAATVATQLLNDFPSIRFGLLVGIGGGVPGVVDVRLGDVVVSQPTGTFGGVVQYDMGKMLGDGRLERIGQLNEPPAILSANVRRLESQHRREGHKLSLYISEMFQRYPKMQTKYAFPAAERDQLFLATYTHRPGPSCLNCDEQQTVPRSQRPNSDSEIHYGTIGSANIVVKDAILRDKLQEEMGIICVEMEAAGLMNDFRCIIIRGICDYADSHKNDKFQPYAAAAAAAYMKELLLLIPSQQVKKTRRATDSAATRFDFLLPCLGSLDDLVQAELQRPTHTIDLQSALDNLAWLIHTRAFSAWMSPARGEVICSRWLWYSGSASENVVRSLIVYLQSRQIKTLFFDCSQIFQVFSSYIGRLSRLSQEISSKLALILWSFIAQAYGSEDLKSAEVADRIHERVKSQDQTSGKRSDAGDQIPLQKLCEILRSALNYRPSRGVLLLLHRAEELSAGELEVLRNAVQDVMDSQRTDNVAQTQAFVTCRKSYEADIALKGIVTVDENTELHECVLHLQFKSMNLRRDGIKDIDLNRSHWLWSHPSYQKWNRDRNRVLWISGKPGSGKSVLARNLESRLLTDSYQSRTADRPPIVCSWFYSARNGLVSHRMMLRALLSQMLLQDSDLFSEIVTVCRCNNGNTSGLIWPASCLQEALLAIVRSSASSRRILLVVDGIDESLEDAEDEAGISRKDALSFLERLTDGFQVLILSRYHSSIEQRLRRSYQIFLHEENMSDIERVVDEGLISLLGVIRPEDHMYRSSGSNPLTIAAHEVSQVQSNPTASRARGRGQRQRARGQQQRARIQANHEELLQSIKNHILQNVSGVILWATTILSLLRNRIVTFPSYRVKDLWATLESLPSDLDDLYKEIVQNLNSTSKANVDFSRRALIWINVATSRRPFQLQELYEALRIPSTIDDMDEDEDPFLQLSGVDPDSPTSFFRYIQRLCGPFIEVVRRKANVLDATENVMRQTRWNDNIQLTHQTVKVFLETSTAAGPFRTSFNQAEQLVEDESRRYLELSVPSNPPSYYTPSPVELSIPWREAVVDVLAYLEEKYLLSFILLVFPTLKSHVPYSYIYIFEQMAYPSIEHSRSSPPEQDLDFSIRFHVPESSRRQNAVVEHYFQQACLLGYNTAVENLFNLTSLRFDGEQWKWYREEVAILHGALVVAIQHRLVPQVKKIAWYIQQRGIKLLDFPSDLVLGSVEQPYLVQEVLKAANIEIATIVIGYRDEVKKRELFQSLQPWLHRGREELDTDQNEIEAIRDTIETVIGFWKRPSTYDRSSEATGTARTYQSYLDSVDYNFGPSIDFSGEDSGANLAMEEHEYIAMQQKLADLKTESQKPADTKTKEETEEDVFQKPSVTTELQDRTKWLSYQELSQDVAILHGGRSSANATRLQPVDLEGLTIEAEFVDVDPEIQAIEADYMREMDNFDWEDNLSEYHE